MGLGGAEQQLAAGDAIGRTATRGPRRPRRPRPAGPRRGAGRRRAGSSATGVVGDQPVGRRAQARREVVEGGHRRLRVPELERADVRLRVAVARELLLGQPGGEAGGADAAADRQGELTLIDDDATALLGLDGFHGADHTTRSTPGRPSAPRFARRTSTAGCRRAEHDLERGDRGHGPAPFDGRHERAREGRAERRLGQPATAPLLAQLRAERAPPLRRGRGGPAAACGTMLTNI